jgi:hypothetical protein
MRRAHGLRQELFEEPHGRHGECEPSDGAKPGQHQAFREELRDQPSTASA